MTKIKTLKELEKEFICNKYCKCSVCEVTNQTKAILKEIDLFINKCEGSWRNDTDKYCYTCERLMQLKQKLTGEEE